MKYFLKTILFSTVVTLLLKSAVYAQCHTQTKRASVWAGFGSLNADAKQREFTLVNGNKIKDTERRWSVENAPTFNVGFETEGNSRMSFFGDAVVGILESGQTDLEGDYFYDPFGFRNSWVSREQPADSALDHYVQLDFGIDYELIANSNFNWDLRMGFRYTDLALSAKGGFTSFSDLPGVTQPLPANHTQDYKQKLPAAYISPRIDFACGCKTKISFGALAGITFLAETTDFQAARSIPDPDPAGTRISLPHGETELDNAFIWGLDVSIEHKVSERIALYLNASYDEYLEGEGQQQWSQGQTSAIITDGRESSQLQTFQINAGVKFTNTYKPLFNSRPTDYSSIFR